MAELERKYIIPLRLECHKVPKYKRTKKAIRAIKEFLQQHMKIEDVKIGKYLNQAIWARGMKKPPHKVEVTAKKIEDKEGNYVTVELVNAPKEEPKPEAKKKGKLAEKVKDILKAPEDKESVKKEEDIKKEEKLMEKEQVEQEERARAPKEVHRTEPRTDVKQHIIRHTGKSKSNVETTGMK